MAVRPLPPVIYGPIYPISPDIHLGGLFSPAQVIVAGTLSGELLSVPYADPSPEAWLSFSLKPKENEFITVHQVLADGQDSGLQLGSGMHVIGIPNPLPCPGVTRAIHNCSSSITLDALVPGAVIHVLVHGAPLVQAPISRPVQTFTLDPSVPVNPGNVIEIFQTSPFNQDIKHCTTNSLPVFDLHLHNPLPAPAPSPAPKACTNQAQFKDLIEGADLLVTNQGLSLVSSNVARGTELFNLPPGVEWRAGPLTSQQVCPKCDLKSGVNTAVVDPADPLKPPQITPSGVCGQVDQLLVTELNNPATLQVQRQIAGHPELTDTRSTRTTATEWEVHLPADWSLSDPRGEVSFLFQQQTSCGISPLSDPLTVRAAVSSLPQPQIVNPIFECGRFIHVTAASPGCEMHAITQDGIELCDKFTVKSPDFVIHDLYHPLVAGTQVLVIQIGCGRDWKSPPAPVLPVPRDEGRIPQPQIESVPVYHGDFILEIGNVLPGAWVSALIDGSQFRPAFNIFVPTIEAISPHVSLNLLQFVFLNQQILPFQQICGNYSALSAAPVTVTRPALRPIPSPSTLTKGQRNIIVIDAIDPVRNVRNHPEWGSVTLNGRTFPAGQAQTFDIPATTPGNSLVGTIAETLWNQGTSFNIALRDPPPPPPPPPTTFNLRLTAGGAHFFSFIPATGRTEEVSVTAITWTAIAQWDTTIKKTVSGTLSADGSHLTGQVAFDKPPTTAGTQGTDFIVITGTANFAISNFIPGSIGVFGSIQRVPGDASPASCVGWLMTFEVVDIDGTVDWTCCGVVGTGPLRPFSFVC